MSFTQSACDYILYVYLKEDQFFLTFLQHIPVDHDVMFCTDQSELIVQILTVSWVNTIQLQFKAGDWGVYLTLVNGTAFNLERDTFEKGAYIN